MTAQTTFFYMSNPKLLCGGSSTENRQIQDNVQKQRKKLDDGRITHAMLVSQQGYWILMYHVCSSAYAFDHSGIKCFVRLGFAYVKEACLLPGAKQGKKRKAPDHWPKRHMICGGKIATMFRIMPLAAKNHVNLCLYYDLPLTQRNNCTVLGTATKYYTAT